MAAQLTVWHRARYSYNFVSRVHGAPVEITYITYLSDILLVYLSIFVEFIYHILVYDG